MQSPTYQRFQSDARFLRGDFYRIHHDLYLYTYTKTHTKQSKISLESFLVSIRSNSMWQIGYIVISISQFYTPPPPPKDICQFKLPLLTLIFTPTLKVFVVSRKRRREMSCPSVFTYEFGQCLDKKGCFNAPKIQFKTKKPFRPSKTKKKK